MAKFRVKAFGDEDLGQLPKTIIVEATNREEAVQKGWSIFAEYEDIYVSEAL